jgi:type IV pilus assembly protein PilY1
MNQKIRTIVSAIGVGLGALVAAGAAQADAIITNGTIQMGVNDEGHLNVPYFPDPLGIGSMGLRYVPTGAASTEPGCLCEGWGVGIRSTGMSGYANESSGTAGLTVVSFTSTGATAVSVVNATATGLQVTHNYHPALATPNLYEVTVSITNNTGHALAAGDIVYRRVMDWDIYPTPFSEFVTIGGVPALLGIANGSNLAQSDNNGFNSSNPFSFSSFGLHNVNFVDAGPSDHGALFDFEFLGLAAGATLSFNTYYGAAGSEAAANAARAAVGGMSIYSYGQANVPGGPGLGVPNTFIFGFGSVAGGVLTPVPEPETYAMLLAGLGLLGFAARRRKLKEAAAS